MLIQQKLEYLDTLSPNEKIVAQYIINHKEDIKHLSINEIAKKTYTSPSTTVRLSQKLGFNGWKELKESYLEELNYIQAHFQDIDPNIPFTSHDTIQDISFKIATLLSDAIFDTAQLLHHDDLQKATYFLNQAENIYIFAITNTASIVYDFAYKMRFLYKKVTIIENPEEFHFALRMCKKQDCCIFISYSGETFEIFDTLPLIKKLPCHTISITSLGDNSLKTCTECHLNISTREKLYSKIGHYVSNESIHYILDTLYSCIFKIDYEKNWERKLLLSKAIDSDRRSSVSILQEKE